MNYWDKPGGISRPIIESNYWSEDRRQLAYNSCMFLTVGIGLLATPVIGEAVAVVRAVSAASNLALGVYGTIMTLMTERPEQAVRYTKEVERSVVTSRFVAYLIGEAVDNPRAETDANIAFGVFGLGSATWGAMRLGNMGTLERAGAVASALGAPVSLADSLEENAKARKQEREREVRERKEREFQQFERDWDREKLIRDDRPFQSPGMLDRYSYVA